MRIAFAFLLLMFCGTAATKGQDKAADGITAAVDLLELMLQLSPDAALGPMDAIRDKLDDSSLSKDQLDSLGKRLSPTLLPFVDDNKNDDLHRQSLLLSGSLALGQALPKLQAAAFDRSLKPEYRAACVLSLARYEPKTAIATVDRLIHSQDVAIVVQEAAVDLLARIDQPESAAKLLQCYDQLAPEVRPRVIDALSGRASWASDLLDAMKSKQLDKSVLGANQAMRIAAINDSALSAKLKDVWGAIRTERNPQRGEVMRRVESTLQSSTGDAIKGQVVFRRVCAQCHQLHGEGHNVGPDITRNGRGSFEQLLSNVLDPNLVIGTGFVSRTVLTFDGQVIAGIVTEETDQRLTLKVQGGRSETIAVDDIDTQSQTGLSLMPEGLETQLTEQEMIDLFALLTLELPPGTSDNRIIAGTPTKLHAGK